MRGDFAHHFGAWLLVTGCILPFVYGLFLAPLGTQRASPSRTFFITFGAVLFCSLFCSLVDYFAVPAIIAFVKNHWRRMAR